MNHNDMIYEFLNLDVKYSHRIVSLKPSIYGISYDTSDSITICKDNIVGYTSGICLDLKLNKQESYVSDSQNKLIVFEDTNKKYKFSLRLGDNMYVLTIYDFDTDTVLSSLCTILPNTEIIIKFNKNVILGGDTIQSLKEKGMSVYEHLVKKNKYYICVCENSKDNIVFICKSFTGLGTGLGTREETNLKLIDNNYSHKYYKI